MSIKFEFILLDICRKLKVDEDTIDIGLSDMAVNLTFTIYYWIT